MRLNKYIALATGLSRRAADAIIAAGRVQVSNRPAKTGQQVEPSDTVSLDGHTLTPPATSLTIMLHKPVGYVSSRQGQGSRTVYDLLPPELHHLKPAGRLDKDSSGLLLLTNDGDLANQLTHPRYAKEKIYTVELDKPLAQNDIHKIMNGVPVEDYISKMRLKKLDSAGNNWQVSLHQGKNRQIRRTFGALGYTVTKLHRTKFGDYELGDLLAGHYQETS